MTPKYRAALFDLDDTIFDHQHHRREALSAVARAVPRLAVVDLLDLEAAHDVHLQRTHIGLLDGRLSVQGARTERMHALLADFGVERDAGRVDRCEAIYRAAYDREWQAVPGVRELLHSLRDRRIWLGVITNGLLSEQTAKLERVGLEVDALICSEEVGSRKPARDFFAHAVGRAGVAPSECVVVGDLWDVDIRGALDFGIDAIWLNRYGRPSEPHPKVIEIQSFTPVAAMLDLFLRHTVQLEDGRL
jgi:putative hydrolase of the HAD superfamily